MKYESEIIAEILEKRGHETSSLHYESECIEMWIENVIGKFPYETITDVTEATTQNLASFIGGE